MIKEIKDRAVRGEHEIKVKPPKYDIGDTILQTIDDPEIVDIKAKIKTNPPQTIRVKTFVICSIESISFNVWTEQWIYVTNSNLIGAIPEPFIGEKIN